MTKSEIIQAIGTLNGLIETLNHTKVDEYEKTQKNALNKINELIAQLN
jgi:hypothetical protein